MTQRRKAAIIGSGNIGTDLMYKVMRRSEELDLVAMAGIDPASEGLARAKDAGVSIHVDGIRGLLEHDDLDVVFDATSAAAHQKNWEALADRHEVMIDLTPAAIGPFVVPPVNLNSQRAARNVNMVTCGGQATVPIVAAVSSVAPVLYAEIVSSIASKSAGPGTRANIDEFTQTTSAALREVGGTAASKAIIVLNPADPPILMRNTVMCVVDEADEDRIRASVGSMVTHVNAYVPGYRLAQKVQFRSVPRDHPDQDVVPAPAAGDRTVITVLLEVTGAADFLPPYAGNLDIMTSAALQTADSLFTSPRAEVPA